MKPPVPPSPKGLGKKQIPQPEYSRTDPPEETPAGDNKKLAEYIRKSQQPTPEEQREQEAMSEQMARQLASLRSRRAQEATGSNPLKLVKHEGRDPPDPMPSSQQTMRPRQPDTATLKWVRGKWYRQHPQPESSKVDPIDE